MCGGRHRGYGPGKPRLAPMLNGGPWEAGGLRASLAQLSAVLPGGSPSPEPQSPHLCNGTVQEPLPRVVQSILKSKKRQGVMRLEGRWAPLANKRSRGNTEDSSPQGPWRLKGKRVQQRRSMSHRWSPRGSLHAAPGCSLRRKDQHSPKKQTDPPPPMNTQARPSRSSHPHRHTFLWFYYYKHTMALPHLGNPGLGMLYLPSLFYLDRATKKRSSHVQAQSSSTHSL